MTNTKGRYTLVGRKVVNRELVGYLVKDSITGKLNIINNTVIVKLASEGKLSNAIPFKGTIRGKNGRLDALPLV